MEEERASDRFREKAAEKGRRKALSCSEKQEGIPTKELTMTSPSREGASHIGATRQEKHTAINTDVISLYQIKAFIHSRPVIRPRVCFVLVMYTCLNLTG